VGSIRVYYGEHGREDRRSWLQITLIVIAIVVVASIAIWLIGYALFNMGGSVPGTGTGDVLQP
jgi:hypothetical protein